MTKFLLFVLALAAGLMAVRALRQNAPRKNLPRKAEAGSKRMVACALCSLHVPLDEALIDEGKTFCCEDHRARMRS